MIPPLATDIGGILGIVGSIIALVVVGAGLYAVFRSSAADARIKRLQDERDDYLSRLNYIEPKFVEVEQQNKLLRDLHNPTARLEALGTTQSEILDVLESQETLLTSINNQLLHNPGAAP